MRYIKIVHGSRNVFRRLAPQIAWMDELKNSLSNQDTEVRTHRWSGLPLDALRQASAKQFLNSVRCDLESLIREGRWTSVSRLFIISKSLGATIVERAFLDLQEDARELSCEVFLRLAPPEATGSLFAKTTVNVCVPWDHLALGAKAVSLFATHKNIGKSGGRTVNVRLKGLTHKALNRNVVVPEGEFAGKRLFDVYADLLDGIHGRH